MRLRFTRRAVRDVEEARRYLIAREGDRVAYSVLSHKAIERLVTFPLSGRPGRVVGTRELVVPRAAFVVSYRIQGDDLQILAVLHHAQRWPDRF